MSHHYPRVDHNAVAKQPAAQADLDVFEPPARKPIVESSEADKVIAPERLAGAGRERHLIDSAPLHRLEPTRIQSVVRPEHPASAGLGMVEANEAGTGDRDVGFGQSLGEAV